MSTAAALPWQVSGLLHYITALHLPGPKALVHRSQYVGVPPSCQDDLALRRCTLQRPPPTVC